MSCVDTQLPSAEAERRTESERANTTQCLKEAIFKHPRALQTNLPESLTLQPLYRERSTSWSPCDRTCGHESYLERWVILSDFDRHRIWHLGAVISHCYQGVVDETRVVCGMPRCRQHQEPITSQSKRQTCSLLGEQPGGFSPGGPGGPARTRPPRGRETDARTFPRVTRSAASVAMA